jgi:hypothetical protein
MQIYEYDTSIQNVVFGVAGAGCFLTLCVLLLVVKHFDSALIRASSRSFMLLTLIFILIMLTGAVLYAIVPALSESYICHLRPWFTCISIMGVLAILTAKANRIRNIFVSNELTLKEVNNQHWHMFITYDCSSSFDRAELTNEMIFEHDHMYIYMCCIVVLFVFSP